MTYLSFQRFSLAVVTTAFLMAAAPLRAGGYSPEEQGAELTRPAGRALLDSPSDDTNLRAGKSKTGKLAPVCAAAPAAAQNHTAYSEQMTASSEFLNSGTAMGWSGDEKAWYYALPFAFTFYGVSYNSLYVHANGFLDFASSTPDNTPSWSSMLLNKRIAPYWADLYTNEIYIYQPSANSVCIRWKSETFTNGVPVNVEVVLYQNGNVKFNYGSGNSDVVYPVIGMSAGNSAYYDVAFLNSKNDLTNSGSEIFTPLNGAPPTAIFNVTANPPAAGTASPSGMTTVTVNTGTAVSATLNSGYKFQSWWATGGPVYFADTVAASTTASLANNASLYAQYLYSGAGTVAAWGENSYGEIAAGPRVNYLNKPVYVCGGSGAPLSSVQQISAGFYHALILAADGSVWSWGYNNYGQLGNGTTTTSNTPVQVQKSGGTALGGITAISAGGYHNLALASDGTVWAWGYNVDGRLGDGTTTTRLTAVQVKSSGSTVFSGVTAVRAGNWQSLAISGGNVWGWGSNNYGQLGDGTTTQRLNPVQTTNSLGAPFAATAIASGYACSYAITSDGSAFSWGNNSFGQLGDGTTTSKTNPGVIKKSGGSSLTGVSKISSQLIFAMALTSGGSVVAWGDNSTKQCGPLPDAAVLYATEVLSGSVLPYSDVAAGYYHSAALRGDGTVWTWGLNDCGQLGNGTLTGSATPVRVGGIINNTSSSGAKLSASCYATYAWCPGTPAINRVVNDYNGDGMSDLFFQETTGTMMMYFMNGTSMKSSGIVSLGESAVPAVFGDFNGDGYCDLLARNPNSNDMKVFLMSGSTVLSSGTLLAGASDWKAVGAGDLNGDGKTDIIWRNDKTGVVMGYLMNGLNYSASGIIYNGADPAWYVVGVGDLNGDGYADIVWRNSSNGQVIGYLMCGLNILSWGTIYNGADPAWRVVGVGDLNGDGCADIVWRNSSTGQVIGYLMNGLSMISWGSIYDGANPNMRVAILGDFNGDGRTDISMRDNSTGNVLVYLMNGLTISSQGTAFTGGTSWNVATGTELSRATLTMAVSGSGTVTPAPGARTVPTGEAQNITAVAAGGYRFAGWTVSGSAVLASPTQSSTTVTLESAATVTALFTTANTAKFDFNKDGKSDLLWRNTSNGYVAMWLMNGAQALNVGIIFDTDPTWVPVGKGDFNGDGYCDIIWRRSTTGAVVIWFMNGLTMTSYSYVSGASYDSVIGVGDFNGDGYADILWRNSDGAVYMSLMQGATVLGGAKIFEAGTNWIPCGTGDFNGDGYCDILWRDTSSGNAAMWLMNGLSTLSGQTIFIGSQGWTPKSCGDYNGDGCCDIAWQDSSGNAAVWLMNGFTTLSSGYIYQGGDSSWKIMESGDYAGTGKSCVVWRNDTTGQALMYFMNGVTVTGWTVIFNGDVNWTIIK
jgi:alpha-tubulin suppressor-like RCC1 family protein